MPARASHARLEHCHNRLPCSFSGCHRWFRNTSGLTQHINAFHEPAAHLLHQFNLQPQTDIVPISNAPGIDDFSIPIDDNIPTDDLDDMPIDDSDNPIDNHNFSIDDDSILIDNDDIPIDDGFSTDHNTPFDEGIPTDIEFSDDQAYQHGDIHLFSEHPHNQSVPPSSPHRVNNDFGLPDTSSASTPQLQRITHPHINGAYFLPIHL